MRVLVSSHYDVCWYCDIMESQYRRSNNYIIIHLQITCSSEVFKTHKAYSTKYVDDRFVFIRENSYSDRPLVILYPTTAHFCRVLLLKNTTCYHSKHNLGLSNQNLRLRKWPSSYDRVYPMKTRIHRLRKWPKSYDLNVALALKPTSIKRLYPMYV